MTREITTTEAIRYNRQISLAGFDLEKQEQLINSKALIVGAGGLGCAAAQFLVAAGVGALTIMDDDLVELSNLQRQILHKEEMLGASKVHSAKDSLAKLNSLVKLNTLEARADEHNLPSLLTEHDIVLDCSDMLETRNLVNKLAYKHATPLVSGAAIKMEGQIFCVDPRQQTACYGCLNAFFSEQELTCVESGVMSPVVGIIGSYQALEAIKMLTNYGDALTNRLLIFDALNAQWQEFKVKKAPSCVICK